MKQYTNNLNVHKILEYNITATTLDLVRNKNSFYFKFTYE